MVRTLMAHSPWLARTIIMVPKGHFVHNPSLPLARTIFQVPNLFELLKFLYIQAVGTMVTEK